MKKKLSLVKLSQNELKAVKAGACKCGCGDQVCPCDCNCNGSCLVGSRDGSDCMGGAPM